jgi:glycerol-3-phosphate acyltransferase PlsY
MPVAVSDFFRNSNYLEAGLWWALALVMLVTWIRSRHSAAIVAAATLLAFGFSDVVEASTGAWWRPWWLLLWKALCVGVLLVLLIRHARGVRRHHGLDR